MATKFTGLRPVRFCRITQPFANPDGYASSTDRHGRAGHHTGIDFGSAWPLPINGRFVRSGTPGTVVISEYNSTMGHWVGVYYARENVTITYWHLSKRLVQVGAFVQRGQRVGRVGNTGNSTAPHLHVQANRGRGFDYSAHVAPGRWTRGTQWWRRFVATDAPAKRYAVHEHNGRKRR